MQVKTRNALVQIAEAILEGGAKKATKYISETYTVKGTRKHEPRKGERITVMTVTVGRPNYAERAFIAKCKKAGEPFPVKKVQLKFPSAK